MPVAVRAYVDRGRACRRYRPFVLVAAVILTFQLILAYGIYRINRGSEDVEDPNSGVGTGHQVKSVQRSRYDEDDFLRSEDERAQLAGNELGVVPVTYGHDGNPYLERHPQYSQPSSRRTTIDDGVVGAKDVRNRNVTVSEIFRALEPSELSFRPDCAITTKEAVSAIRRAKTLSCKQEIANLTCLDHAGRLYPKRLPRYCPSKGRKMGEHLGCFQDEKKQRLLSGHLFKQANNTPERCTNLCLQSGYPLAGLQYGMECFCGDTYPSAKLILSQADCDIPCSGDESIRCGGYYKMDIYHTGLSKLPRPQPDSMTVLNSTEPPARVLYLLTLNGRAVRQVRRLIKALYHVQSYFFIHVDSRQDYLFRELLPLETQFANIRLSRWRLSTIWGGASLLSMMLHCMEEVLDIVDWNDWDFFINLSESDFPIKTHKELIAFLTKNKKKNFLKSHGKDTQRFITRQGLDKTFHECDTHMWRIGNRELPMGIRIDGGSDWVAISRDFVWFVVHDSSELTVGLKTIFRQTLLPAESFFHILLQNSKFCETSVDNNLHVTNWKRKVGCRCQYKHVVDWCGCSPNVFKPEDWKRIRTADSRPFYFARKFEPIINQAVIDQLETWLYGPVPEDMSALTSYWQNEYHFNDTSPMVDDAFYTIYRSFSRLSVNLLEYLARTCMLSTVNVLEATLYNEKDTYKGTLVLFEATSETPHVETVLLETQVMPRQFYEVFKLIGSTARLKYMQVGTQYDQKEQLFRNLGQIIGPRSEPCLLHKWGEGEAFTATFIWVDPMSTVAGSFEVKVDAGTHTNFHKPNFLQPLIPGKWTVKLMHEWETVAETKFLVVPLSHVGTKEIDPQQSKLLNGGSKKRKYVDHNFTSIERLLGYDDDESRRLSESFRANGELRGKDLLDWIDVLVSQFYSIQDTCYVQAVSKASTDPACPSVVLDTCHSVGWSSRYPDPKSVIGKVNKASGRLER